MAVNTDNSAQDKLRPIIRQIFLERPDYPFTRIQIQKILFKLKENLQHNYPDYPVFEILPSYWYYEGPFSPRVNNEIKKMAISGELTPTQGNRAYKLTEGAHFLQSGLEQYVIKELRPIVKPFSPDYFNKLVAEIYKGAPSEFMPVYKYRYLSPFSKAANKMHIPADASSEWEDALYNCERKVPRVDYFGEYKRLFSSFVTEATIVMDYMKESGDYNLLTETYRMSESVWNRFAEGVRIQDNAHDPPFAFELEYWHDIFDTRTERLCLALNNFTAHVINNVQFEEEIEEDDDTKEILAAIVNSYFSAEDFL
jgi:hypothetical protein